MLVLLRISFSGVVQRMNQIWVPLDMLCSLWCMKLLASALPWMCFYKDPIKLVPLNPLE